MDLRLNDGLTKPTLLGLLTESINAGHSASTRAVYHLKPSIPSYAQGTTVSEPLFPSSIVLTAFGSAPLPRSLDAEPMAIPDYHESSQLIQSIVKSPVTVEMDELGRGSYECVTNPHKPSRPTREEQLQLSLARMVFTCKCSPPLSVVHKPLF